MTMHSERLIVEPITEALAAELEQALRLPAVYARVNDGQMPTHEDFLRDVSVWAAGPGPGRPEQRWMDLALRLRRTDALVGRMSATWHRQQVELAYFLTPASWGQGLASEAVQWLEAHCERSWPVERFWIVVTPGNERSLALATRLGYAPLGEAPRPSLFSFNDGDWVMTRPAGLNAPRPSWHPGPPRPAAER